MASPHTGFDSLVSTTLANYRTTLEDNVSSNTALWWWMKRNNKVVDKEAGGTNFEIPLLYGLNSNFGTYSMYDTLATDPQDGITTAEYPWRNAVVTIPISGEEEAKNNGPQKVQDLLKAKFQQAEVTASEKFDLMFHGDGTGNSGKDFLGLDALIGDGSSSVTTVGAIDASVSGNAFWRSTVNTTAGALTVAQIAALHTAMTRGPQHPDYGETTPDLYGKYESLLTPNLRYTNNEMADAGFMNLAYRQTPVTFGDNVPAGEWIFLNSAYVSLIRHTQDWAKQSGPVVPHDVDAKYWRLIWRGNLVISNRQLGGGKLTAKTV